MFGTDKTTGLRSNQSAALGLIAPVCAGYSNQTLILAKLIKLFPHGSQNTSALPVISQQYHVNDCISSIRDWLLAVVEPQNEASSQ